MRTAGLVVALAVILIGVASTQRYLHQKRFAGSIRSGNWHAVRMQLESGAPITATSPNGTTPLMLAAQAGDLSYLRKLLADGADIDAVNRDGSTALTWAAGAGQADAVALLLDAGAAYDLGEAGDEHSPRYAAFVGGHQALHQELVRRERLTHEMLGLWDAPKAPPIRIEKLRRLLDRGAIVNGSDINGTALRWAASGELEPAAFLLKRGADPNSQPGRVTARVSPLEVAVARGNRPMVRLLLAHGADPNRANYGAPPLFDAADLGDVDLVRQLIAAGADVHYRFSNGESALTFAQKKGHREVIQILQQAGAR